MVTVTDYKILENKMKETFFALELTGSLELVQSQNTGRFYATVRRCSIPSTFDATVAEAMVGTQIEGNVVRVPCDPYEYTIERTGEVMTLGYTYSYQPPGSKELVGHGTIEIRDNTPTETKPMDAITASAQRKRKQLAKTN